MKNIFFKLIVLEMLLVSSVSAQSLQRFANIGDLKLQSGKTLYNCQIGYRTFGSINVDSSNIIIYPSWFGGTSEAIGTLIQKYNFIDTTKYFIIAVDGLGNGISTSISNSDNPDSVFYNLTIDDMVNANYLLLLNHFNIKKIFAAVGGSMGSMQVLLMAVMYPNLANKIVAYVATPKMTSSDLLWMNTQQNLIELTLNCGMPEREVKKLSDMLAANFARTPDYVTTHTDLSEFPDYLKSFDKEPNKIFTLQNFLTQLKAMMKLDISKYSDGLMEETAKKIKAKMFIIVSKSDLMVNPVEAINLAQLTESKLIILDNNCGHLAVSCEIERCRKEIDLFLNE